ncbi:MAG: hypothetical protein WC444_05195 [Candidatus Paceibacterota bacterium]
MKEFFREILYAVCFMILAVLVAWAIISLNGCGGDSELCLSDFDTGMVFCYNKNDCSVLSDGTYSCTFDARQYDSSTGDACMYDQDCGDFNVCVNGTCTETCIQYTKEYTAGRNEACGGMSNECSTCCCLSNGPFFDYNQELNDGFGGCEENRVDCGNPFFLMLVKRNGINKETYKEDQANKCEQTVCSEYCNSNCS